MMNGYVDTGWVMWLVTGGGVTALWVLVVLAVVALARPAPRTAHDVGAPQDARGRR